MQGRIHKFHWLIDFDSRVLGYQESDHLLWAYHFPLFSFAWRRAVCACHQEGR